MKPFYFNALPIAADHTNFFLTQEEKKDLLKLNFENKPKNTRASINYDILKMEKFSRIKDFLVSEVDKFRKDVLCIENKLVMTRSWATLNEKDVGHSCHIHPNAIFSLVYYVDCDIDSGNFVIRLPKCSLQDGYMFNFKITKINEFNSNQFHLKTSPGMVVIFPGHLEHYSTPHKADKERLIIGANFFFEGHFGAFGYDELDLKVLETDSIEWGQ